MRKLRHLAKGSLDLDLASPTRRFAVHRARSATRSKPVTQALRASGRSTWQVDESATGSVNFFGPRSAIPRRNPASARRRRPRRGVAWFAARLPRAVSARGSRIADAPAHAVASTGASRASSGRSSSSSSSTSGCSRSRSRRGRRSCSRSSSRSSSSSSCGRAATTPVERAERGWGQRLRRYGRFAARLLSSFARALDRAPPRAAPWRAGGAPPASRARGSRAAGAGSRHACPWACGRRLSTLQGIGRRPRPMIPPGEGTSSWSSPIEEEPLLVEGRRRELGTELGDRAELVLREDVGRRPPTARPSGTGRRRATASRG